MHSLLFPFFCDHLLLWARLRATPQALQPDSLLGQPPLFCDRAWLLVHPQGTLQAQATQWFRWSMPSFQLSFARDVLQATRPGWATELG
jgi:hypothetical protein